MSTAGFILFFFSAIAAIAGAVATVAARRPLRAAMGLLVNVIALSALYLTLHAQLLAVLQLLVYAGAVVVLFVFVILLIGPAGEVESTTGAITSRVLAACAGGAVLLMTAFTLIRYDVQFAPTPEGYGTVRGARADPLRRGGGALRDGLDYAAGRHRRRRGHRALPHGSRKARGPRRRGGPQARGRSRGG